MILFCDENGCIYDVDTNTTGDATLIQVEVNDEDNPFANWTTAKICCYRCHVTNGRVDMMTPRVDSRLIEHIDMLGREVESVTPYKQTKTAYIDDTSITFTEVPEGNMSIFCPVDYKEERIGNTVTVSFEPLTEVIEITIMIQ